MDPHIREVFEYSQPLSVDMFENVAKVYRLPQLKFNSNSTKLMEICLRTRQTSGQFRVDSKIKAGIIRQVTKNDLVESFQIDGQTVGLSRTILRTGLVNYEVEVAGMKVECISFAPNRLGDRIKSLNLIFYKENESKSEGVLKQILCIQ